MKSNNKNVKKLIIGAVFLSSTSLSLLVSTNLINNNLPFKNSLKSLTKNSTYPSNLEELRNMNKDDIINLPKLDLRDFNLVTSVKDQGAEGICWAFAMSASSEVNMLYKEGVVDSKYNGSNFSLSAKNIDRVVNIRNGNYDKLGLTNDDIINRNLGNATVKMFLSSQLLTQQNGPIIGQINANAGPGNNAAWLETIESVPNDVLEIKKSIAKYGSVAFAYKTSGDTFYLAPKGLNHAAAIVGWDDTIPKEKFCTNQKPNYAKRDGAWIVKNSWGPDVYDKGFFYLSYDSHIEDIIAFDYSNKSKYENTYYYSGLEKNGYSREIGNKKVAAIFPAKKSSYNKVEKLKGISFGLGGQNAKVKATIYINVQANPFDRYSKYNNPESGIKVHEQESEIFPNKDHFGGFYTMELNKEIELEPGTYFSVVLEVISKDKFAQILVSSEPNSYNDLTFYEKEKNNWNNAWTEAWGTGQNSVIAIKGLTITENKEGNPDNNLFYGGKINTSTNEVVFTGDEVNISDLTITYNSKILTFGVDYDIEYLQIMNSEESLQYISEKGMIGSLKITAKGKGQYKGEISTYVKFIKGDAEKPLYALTRFGNDYNKETNKINLKFSNLQNPHNTTYGQIKLPKDFVFTDPNKILIPGSNVNNPIKYVGIDAYLYKVISFETNVNFSIEINVENEKTRIDKIDNLAFIKEEYNQNEIDSINANTLFENLKNWSPDNENFTYQVIDFSNNIETKTISFKIKILRDGKEAISKEFALMYKISNPIDPIINELNKEKERIDKINNLVFKKEEYSQDEINSINAETLFNNLNNWNPDPSFNYQVIELNKEVVNKISFKIRVSKDEKFVDSRLFELFYRLELDDPIIAEIQSEITKIESSNITLKQAEYTQQQIDEITPLSLFNELSNIQKDPKFNYEIIDLNKIVASKIIFKIRISKDGKYVESKEITLSYKIISGENQSSSNLSNTFIGIFVPLGVLVLATIGFIVYKKIQKRNKTD